MAHLLGGTVQKGDKGEYGLATLDLRTAADSRYLHRASPARSRSG